MSKKCNNHSCNRTTFESSDYCVLHCEKHTYSENISMLHDFYNTLIDYIVGTIKKIEQTPDDLTLNLARKYLSEEEGSPEIIKFFQNKIFSLDGILFPELSTQDSFNYELILKRVKGINFRNCRFMATSLSLSSDKILYDKCEFLQIWEIRNFSHDVSNSEVRYQNCHFRDDVEIVASTEHGDIVDIPIFKDCIFSQKLAIADMIINKNIFSNSYYTEISIGTLWIDRCIIQCDFILNNVNADSIFMENVTFKLKFEMKDSHISRIFEAKNSNFEGLFDVQGSKFGGFECLKCVFNNVVSFEYCAFSFERKNKEYMATFKYTTFLSFTSFRNSIFHLGLDLENANLKEAPNFLNIELLSDNTNRETLRIIKNSFDKIGNHIDANDFFVKEMKKYKQELSRQGGNWQERMILWFNEKASDFGQSYIKPIVWLLLIAMIYSGLIYAQENDYLYRIYTPFNNVFSWLSQSINNIAKNIIPFKSFAKEGMEFLSLIFYIIFASLTWQTIVAFKRHTKR